MKIPRFLPLKIIKTIVQAAIPMLVLLVGVMMLPLPAILLGALSNSKALLT